MKLIRPEITPFMVQAHMDLGSGSGVGCNSKQLEDGTWEFNWEEKIGFTPPTDAEIKTRAGELQAEYDALQYQRDREPNYPRLAEQFDLLWHAIDADTLDKTSDFYTTLKAVKDAHPKG